MSEFRRRLLMAENQTPIITEKYSISMDKTGNGTYSINSANSFSISVTPLYSYKSTSVSEFTSGITNNDSTHIEYKGVSAYTEVVINGRTPINVTNNGTINSDTITYNIKNMNINKGDKIIIKSYATDKNGKYVKSDGQTTDIKAESVQCKYELNILTDDYKIRIEPASPTEITKDNASSYIVKVYPQYFAALDGQWHDMTKHAPDGKYYSGLGALTQVSTNSGVYSTINGTIVGNHIEYKLSSLTYTYGTTLAFKTTVTDGNGNSKVKSANTTIKIHIPVVSDSYSISMNPNGSESSLKTLNYADSLTVTVTPTYTYTSDSVTSTNHVGENWKANSEYNYKGVNCNTTLTIDSVAKKTWYGGDTNTKSYTLNGQTYGKGSKISFSTIATDKDGNTKASITKSYSFNLMSDSYRIYDTTHANSSYTCNKNELSSVIIKVAPEYTYARDGKKYYLNSAKYQHSDFMDVKVIASATVDGVTQDFGTLPTDGIYALVKLSNLTNYTYKSVIKISIKVVDKNNSVKETKNVTYTINSAPSYYTYTFTETIPLVTYSNIHDVKNNIITVKPIYHFDGNEYGPGSNGNVGVIADYKGVNAYIDVRYKNRSSGTISSGDRWDPISYNVNDLKFSRGENKPCALYQTRVIYDVIITEKDTNNIIKRETIKDFETIAIESDYDISYGIKECSGINEGDSIKIDTERTFSYTPHCIYKHLYGCGLYGDVLELFENTIDNNKAVSDSSPINGDYPFYKGIVSKVFIDGTKYVTESNSRKMYFTVNTRSLGIGYHKIVIDLYTYVGDEYTNVSKTINFSVSAEVVGATYIYLSNIISHSLESVNSGFIELVESNSFYTNGIVPTYRYNDVDYYNKDNNHINDNLNYPGYVGCGVKYTCNGQPINLTYEQLGIGCKSEEINVNNYSHPLRLDIVCTNANGDSVIGTDLEVSNSKYTKVIQVLNYSLDVEYPGIQNGGTYFITTYLRNSDNTGSRAIYITPRFCYNKTWHTIEDNYLSDLSTCYFGVYADTIINTFYDVKGVDSGANIVYDLSNPTYNDIVDDMKKTGKFELTSNARCYYNKYPLNAPLKKTIKSYVAWDEYRLSTSFTELEHHIDEVNPYTIDELKSLLGFEAWIMPRYYYHCGSNSGLQDLGVFIFNNNIYLNNQKDFPGFKGLAIEVMFNGEKLSPIWNVDVHDKKQPTNNTNEKVGEIFNIGSQYDFTKLQGKNSVELRIRTLYADGRTFHEGLCREEVYNIKLKDVPPARYEYIIETNMPTLKSSYTIDEFKQAFNKDVFVTPRYVYDPYPYGANKKTYTMAYNESLVGNPNYPGYSGVDCKMFINGDDGNDFTHNSTHNDSVGLLGRTYNLSTYTKLNSLENKNLHIKICATTANGGPTNAYREYSTTILPNPKPKLMDYNFYSDKYDALFTANNGEPNKFYITSIDTNNSFIPFNILSKPSWVIANIVGNSTLSVLCDDNTSYDLREGEIILEQNNSRYNLTIKIKQLENGTYSFISGKNVTMRFGNDGYYKAHLQLHFPYDTKNDTELYTDYHDFTDNVSDESSFVYAKLEQDNEFNNFCPFVFNTSIMKKYAENKGDDCVDRIVFDICGAYQDNIEGSFLVNMTISDGYDTYSHNYTTRNVYNQGDWEGTPNPDYETGFSNDPYSYIGYVAYYTKYDILTFYLYDNDDIPKVSITTTDNGVVSTPSVYNVKPKDEYDYFDLLGHGTNPINNRTRECSFKIQFIDNNLNKWKNYRYNVYYIGGNVKELGNFTFKVEDENNGQYTSVFLYKHGFQNYVVNLSFIIFPGTDSLPGSTGHAQVCYLTTFIEGFELYHSSIDSEVENIIFDSVPYFHTTYDTEHQGFKLTKHAVVYETITKVGNEKRYVEYTSSLDSNSKPTCYLGKYEYYDDSYLEYPASKKTLYYSEPVLLHLGSCLNEERKIKGMSLYSAPHNIELVAAEYCTIYTLLPSNVNILTGIKCNDTKVYDKGNSTIDYVFNLTQNDVEYSQEYEIWDLNFNYSKTSKSVHLNITNNLNNSGNVIVTGCYHDNCYINIKAIRSGNINGQVNLGNIIISNGGGTITINVSAK